MDSHLALRLLFSFAIAGTWISAASLASEALGSRLGGLVANLPSNILISLIFMALTQGPGYAAEAAASVPLGMAVDSLFLLAFMAVLPRGLGPALGAGLLAWLASAALCAFVLPPLSLALGIGVYAAVALGCFAIAELAMKVRAVEKRPSARSGSALVVRALFAGTVVAGAVAAAQAAPAYLTGIIAPFPAVLLSTMVILTRSQGQAFARATGKVLLLSSSNIVVYVLGVALLFPKLGPWWGTACAFALAVAYVAAMLPLVRRIR